MNTKQRATLNAIFACPTRADVKWSDIEALFAALGASIQEGRGSRMRVTLGGARAGFHRPHPSRIAGKGLVESVRDFLEQAGVQS